MALFDFFKNKRASKQTSAEYEYAKKRVQECNQNAAAQKLPVPPRFGKDKSSRSAAEMILSMTRALFFSKDAHNESDIDQAISLYAYIFAAKTGGLDPVFSETWVVKRRTEDRSSKAIEEGVFSKEGVQKATQIALEYIYAHIPFFADRDKAYLNSVKEMKRLLPALTRGRESTSEFAQGVRSYVQKAAQLGKEGHPAWAAEWLETLINALSPAVPCYDDPTGQALFDGSLMEYMQALVHYPDKDISHSMIPYKSIYKLYAFVLAELDYYDDALAMLRNAQAFNPYSIDVMSETLFVFSKLDRWEETEKMVWKMLDCAYSKQHFAAAFRAMGSVFVHRELWHSAMACYQASLYYQPESAVAANEMQYITQQSGIHPLGDDEVSAELQKCGLPSMFNPVIYRIAEHGVNVHQNESRQQAQYFKSVCNEMLELTYIASEKLKYLKGIEHKQE